MFRFHLSVALVVLSSLLPGVVAEGSEESSADIVTLLIPLGTYAIANSKDDDEGKSQFLRSTGMSLVLNSAARLAFNETSWGERPNGKEYGFPSGHTAFVVSSAAFLQDRYGWQYGVPAYLLSGYVAYVRVDTEHHRWRDIIAGAALSYGVSKLYVTPQHATQIAPVVGPDYLGMSWKRSW
jgi:membrane-associated phospholipid phosphatase